MENCYKVAIIGGGPAGIMAALTAKTKENRVVILEKNPFLGKKLLLTGKGRCNLTTDREIPEIVQAFGRKGKFLYGAFTRFSSQDLRNFFEKRGVGLKIERGGRVFPQSDRSATILNCLKKELALRKITVFYHFNVCRVFFKKGLYHLESPAGNVLAEKLIIATGGKSYPQTGSTGDGYLFAKSFGHQIIKPAPALVPLRVSDPKITALAGLSLKNVSLSFFNRDKLFTREFGEMLFTHFGISGPIVLKASKEVYQQLKKQTGVTASIDLKPALNKTILQKRIYREIHLMPQKEYQTLLKNLLPKSLINYFIDRTGISPHQKNSSLSKAQVETLIAALKNLTFAISATMPLEMAIITSGGVDIAAIDPKTMASKIAPNLYFAGEIIALDGPTGGYNLQKAFSTGWVAGFSSR